MREAGLLLVTLAGFAFAGGLVDQIERFFTENQKEEPVTEKTAEEKIEIQEERKETAEENIRENTKIASEQRHAS